MTVEQAVRLIIASRCYCWALSAYEGRTEIPIKKHTPKPDSRSDKQNDDEGIDDKEVEKLLKQSMEQLKIAVDIYDEARPGAKFKVIYFATRTTPSNAYNGPLEFTRDQADPVAQPLAGLPPANQQPLVNYPAPPTFAEQLSGFGALQQLVQNQGGQGSALIQSLYQERLLELDRRESNLDKERVRMADQFRQDRLDWEEKKSKELRDEKERLRDEMERRLEIEQEKLAMNKKQIGRRKRELEDAKKRVESSANEWGQKVSKGLGNLAERYLLDDEEEIANSALSGTEKQEQPEQETELMRMSRQLAIEAHETGDKNTLIFLQNLTKAMRSNPSIKSDLATFFKEKAAAESGEKKKPVTSDPGPIEEEE